MAHRRINQRRSGRRWLPWAFAAAIALVGLVFIAGWLLPDVLYGDMKQREVSAADRAALITIEDLVPKREVEEAFESMDRYGGTSLIGKVMLSYTYQRSDNTPPIDESNSLTINSLAVVWFGDTLGNGIKARAHWSAIQGIAEGAEKEPTVEEEPELMLRFDDLGLGDESLCILKFRSDQPAGFNFACLVDQRVQIVIVRGRGFVDREAARDFLAPHVERFREYQP